MRSRCPRAKPVFYLNGIRVNKLFGWKLVFNRYANIIKDNKSFVPIGLWKITNALVAIWLSINLKCKWPGGDAGATQNNWMVRMRFGCASTAEFTREVRENLPPPSTGSP